MNSSFIFAARPPRRLAAPAVIAALALAVVPAFTCFGLGFDFGLAPAASAQTLGPADGHDLPGADIERVQVGDEAPLFTLESFDRGPVSLAGFRGDKTVVLVFYRGHW